MIPVFTSLGQENPATLKSEQLYLHIDRNFFVAGEDLFFKLYLNCQIPGSSRFAYLSIRDEKSNIVTSSRLEIKNKISYGSINLADTLKTGFYQIVCFTNLMRNFPETIFTNEIIIANRFDDEATYFSGNKSQNVIKKLPGFSNDSLGSVSNMIITTDKKIYGRREKINFSIEPIGILNVDILSLSISVSQVLGYSNTFPSITYFFSHNKESQSSPKNHIDGLVYKMETNRSAIKGIVCRIPKAPMAGNNETSPLKTFTVFVSTVDTVPNLQCTQTDSSGNFSINLNPYFEGKEVILKLKNKEESKITLDSRYEINEPFKPPLSFDHQKVRDLIKGAVKTGQINRYYVSERIPDTIASFNSIQPKPAVYYKSYQRIYPSDYIELNNFFEISREIIPALRIRKSNGSFLASYPALKYQALSEEEPLMFLDGVPIDNVSQIIDLNTRDIKYIETAPEIRYFDNLYFNGILSLVSRNKAIYNISYSQPYKKFIPENSISFTRPKVFNPVDLPDHYPDLRYVLLWEPDFRPGDNGKMDFEIYSSDLQGEYVINVQGVTKNGLPLSGYSIITVKTK
jgi:hypothetical protein